MTNYTKNGLLLLMIAEIMAILVTIILYGFWFSFDMTNFTSENLPSLFITIIPATILGIVGGLITLIGAGLMLAGCKEFGEKHKQFIIYGLITFIIAIFVNIAIGIISVVAAFSQFSMFSLSSPEVSVDYIRNILPISLAASPISAVVSGLIWVFGLYQLENKNGRIILFAGYISSIITAIVVSISSYIIFEEMINSGNFNDLITSGTSGSSSASQLLSSYSWIGTTALFSLLGGIITGLLLLYALYIPYQRIKEGELVPVSQLSDSFLGEGSDRRCPNCGRDIPFDANACPYCGKRFESFV